MDLLLVTENPIILYFLVQKDMPRIFPVRFSKGIMKSTLSKKLFCNSQRFDKTFKLFTPLSFPKLCNLTCAQTKSNFLVHNFLKKPKNVIIIL